LPYRKKKRRPTIFPSGIIVKKDTIESGSSSRSSRQIGLLKNDMVNATSQAVIEKDSSKEKNESKSSQEHNNLVYQNLDFWEPDNKIVMDSEEDKILEKSQDAKTQELSLIKMSTKNEDVINDPNFPKEISIIPFNENTLLRSESEIKSQKSNDFLKSNNSFKTPLEVKSKNLIKNKGIEETIMLSDPKDDINNFKDKYIIKKQGNNNKNDLNYFFEEDSIAQQNSLNKI
jgi:hypothetical protein